MNGNIGKTLTLTYTEHLRVPDGFIAYPGAVIIRKHKDYDVTATVTVAESDPMMVIEDGVR